MKNCQFCGAELPEEASFCLKCSSVINTREVFEANSKKSFLVYKKAITVSLLIMFVFSLYFLSSASIKAIPTVSADSEEPQTTLIPVTLPNGEEVTDDKGNTVYEAVTVEPSTKKASIFSEIIESIKDKDKDTNNSSDSDTDRKPSSTEQNRDKISESSSKGNNNALSPSSAQSPSPTKTPAKGETDTNENPSEVFEYKNYNSSGTQISITKYKGNASFVTIPVYIDGKMVVQVETNAFKDNSKIKTIDIPKGERSSIWLSEWCFNNLSSLTTVNLYDNDLGTRGNFAVDCPIKDINITHREYKFVDGALYTYSQYGWMFIYFAGNPCYTTLTVPSWCIDIEIGNLQTATNLKIINAHKNVTHFPLKAMYYNKSLEAINVEEGNSKYFSKDGVFFSFSHSYSNRDYIYTCIYPYSKKDRSFTFPQKDKCTFNLDCLSSGYTNPYVEEFYIPLNTHISYSPNYTNSLPNLKKLYFAKGHTDYENIKSKFSGETLLY